MKAVYLGPKEDHEELKQVHNKSECTSVSHKCVLYRRIPCFLYNSICCVTNQTFEKLENFGFTLHRIDFEPFEKIL